MNFRISGQKINIAKEGKYLGFKVRPTSDIQTTYAYSKA